MTDEGIFHTVVFASECKRRKTVPCYVPYQYLMSTFCMIKNHLILPWENFDVSHRIVLFDTPQLNSTIYVFIFSIIYSALSYEIRRNQVNYININTVYITVQKLIENESSRKHVIIIHLYVVNCLMFYI